MKILLAAGCVICCSQSERPCGMAVIMSLCTCNYFIINHLSHFSSKQFQAQLESLGFGLLVLETRCNLKTLCEIHFIDQKWSKVHVRIGHLEFTLRTNWATYHQVMANCCQLLYCCDVTSISHAASRPIRGMLMFALPAQELWIHGRMMFSGLG